MGGPIRYIAGVLIVVCGAAGPASAQICAGAPSFSHYSWRSSLGLEFVGGGTLRASTSLGGGRDALFAAALADVGRPEHSAGPSYTFGVTGGSGQVIHRARRVHVCPVVTALFESGPDIRPCPLCPATVDVSSTSVTAGGVIGWVVHETPARQIVPTIGVSVARERTRATFNGGAGVDAGGPSTDAIDNFALLQLGIGFIFGDQTALTPQIRVPLGHSEGMSLRVLGTFAFSFR